MAQNKKPLIFIKPNVLLFCFHKIFACRKNNDFLNCSFVEHIVKGDFELFHNKVLLDQEKIFAFSKFSFELVSNKNIYLAVYFFP